MELPPEDMKAIIARMKRAHGHLGSVIRMIEDGSDCETVLTQLAAVNKALSRSAYAIVATGLQHCLNQDDTATDEEAKREDLKRMEKLFLALA